MGRWLALGAGIVLVTAIPRTLHAPTLITPRISVVVPSEAGTWLLGARLGMEDARRVARHLRRELQVVEVGPASSPAAAAVREADAGASVLVAAGEGEAWDALERAAVSRGLVLLDARPRYRKDAPCLPGVFRVGLPSHPSDATARRTLWDPSLAGEDAQALDERFRRRFGRTMDEGAWAGWFAVRVAAAAALGVSAPELPTLEGFLGSRAASFEGAKGTPLHFQAASRRLVQPIYAVDDTGDVEPTWSGDGTCAVVRFGAGDRGDRQ